MKKKKWRLPKSEKEEKAEVLENILAKLLLATPIIGAMGLMFFVLADQAMPLVYDVTGGSGAGFEELCQFTDWYNSGCVGEVPPEVSSAAIVRLGTDDEVMIRIECGCPPPHTE